MIWILYYCLWTDNYIILTQFLSLYSIVYCLERWYFGWCCRYVKSFMIWIIYYCLWTDNYIINTIPFIILLFIVWKGTFLAWNSILENDATNNNDGYENDNVVLSSWMACCITKQSTHKAFEKRKRSMTAPDVLEEIGDVVHDIASSTIQQDT